MTCSSTKNMHAHCKVLITEHAPQRRRRAGCNAGLARFVSGASGGADGNGHKLVRQNSAVREVVVHWLGNKLELKDDIAGRAVPAVHCDGNPLVRNHKQ